MFRCVSSLSLRVSSRAWSRSVKTSTGQVGVPVVVNAREVLIGLYQRTLHVVQDLPPEAEYRRTVERISKYRMKVCQENENVEDIENIIDSGIAEELIEQANDELELIPIMQGLV